MNDSQAVWSTVACGGLEVLAQSRFKLANQSSRPWQSNCSSLVAWQDRGVLIRIGLTTAGGDVIFDKMLVSNKVKGRRYTPNCDCNQMAAAHERWPL
jgi:hypothetical protein